MVKKYDYLKILIPVIIICGFSLITLYGVIPQLMDYGTVENEKIFLAKQMIGMLAGFFGVFLLYRLNLDNILKLMNFAYWVLFIMLAILFFNPPIIGDIFVETINGANGWFKIPIIGVTIQPVEFMKVALIFKLAEISYNHMNDTHSTDFTLFKKYFIYGAIPILFVLGQPDLGGALLLGIPFVVMFLVSIKSKKILRNLIIGGVGAVLLGVFLLATPWGQQLLVTLTPLNMYQLERINAWLYPFEYADGFQLQQSLILMGSAGAFGHGMGFSGIYLPEPHTDVIFSEFVGMFGWVMGLILIGLYCFLIIQIIGVGARSKERRYKMIVIGFAVLFTVQVVENIGMMLGVLPITGIVLPFMSYGVSAMITYMGIIGIVININKRIF